MRSRKRPAAGRGRVELARMERHADEASALLKAMASPARLLVLCNLANSERSVAELLERIPLSASALSQHLAVLRHQGLVATRREAQSVYYALEPGPAQDVIDVLYSNFCAPAGGRAGRRRNRRR